MAEFDNKKLHLKGKGHSQKEFYCKCKEPEENWKEGFCWNCGKMINYRRPAKKGCVNFNNYPENLIF